MGQRYVRMMLASVGCEEHLLVISFFELINLLLQLFFHAFNEGVKRGFNIFQLRIGVLNDNRCIVISRFNFYFGRQESKIYPLFILIIPHRKQTVTDCLFSIRHITVYNTTGLFSKKNISMIAQIVFLTKGSFTECFPCDSRIKN